MPPTRDRNVETPVRLRYDAMESLRRELRRDLRQYVDDRMDAQGVRLDAIKDDAEEAKNLGISARDKAMLPHECTQQATLEKFDKTLTSWSNWWKGIMVTIIVAILGLGGLIAGWWSDQGETKRDVVELKNEVVEVKQTVEETQDKVDSFQTTFETHNQQAEKKQAQQVQVITQAVTEVVKSEIRKSRRR